VFPKKQHAAVVSCEWVCSAGKRPTAQRLKFPQFICWSLCRAHGQNTRPTNAAKNLQDKKNRFVYFFDDNRNPIPLAY